MDDNAFKKIMQDATGDQYKAAGRDLSHTVAGFYKGLRDGGVPNQAATTATVQYVTEIFRQMRWDMERRERQP